MDPMGPKRGKGQGKQAMSDGKSDTGKRPPPEEELADQPQAKSEKVNGTSGTSNQVPVQKPVDTATLPAKPTPPVAEPGIQPAFPQTKEEQVNCDVVQLLKSAQTWCRAMMSATRPRGTDQTV